MSHSGKQIRQRKKIKNPEHSLGNWNNWKHFTGVKERSVSGKVDESGSGYFECEILEEGRSEVVSRQMWAYPFIHFLHMFNEQLLNIEYVCTESCVPLEAQNNLK